MLKKIPHEDAVKMILALPCAPKTEKVSLWDAHNRVLAVDIAAQYPSPLFDRSPFDGYAFMACDSVGASAENPVTLQITEEIPAGFAPTIALTHGYAAKILTGSPIPENADAIVKYEDTKFTDTEVTLFAESAPNSNIVRAGEDLKQGEIIGLAGDIITPPHMSVFASQGISELEVFVRSVQNVLRSYTPRSVP